jgi:hypothetical protein
MGWVTCWLLLLATTSRAGDFCLESIGVRGGVPAGDASRDLFQAEAFVNFNLPWGWDLGKEWHLQSRLDLSGGALAEESRTASVATAGPSLVLGRQHLPVSFELGFSPTFISRWEFGTTDFGTDFQFTTHVGLNWDFAAHWCLSYRFQHMSNAGLATHNPGLNMNMLSLSYLF